jgi:class 3 adenylate cyclase
MERKLAAILAADVVGYSRLMSSDESGTHAAVKEVEASIIEPTVSKFRGRIFKRMGDGYLVEFTSAMDVVECALEWQERLRASSQSELRFRIGINLGDVIVDGDDIYGDGVNIAARLEGMAQAGCIAISNDVWNQVRSRIGVPFHDLGEQELKNIPEEVRVWEWRCKQAPPRRLQSKKLPLPKKPSIVLLPFRNLSGDEQQEFLAEGLRIDVQNALTQLSEVFLIAAGSANALRGVEPVDACTSVGVQYALHGSVRSTKSKVRVSAELLDGVEGRCVWADSYDCDLDDPFELQDEVTRKILTAMKVKLVAGEQARIWDKTLKDPKALQRFYKGVHAFFKMNQEDMLCARKYFESVAKMHPETSIGATWIALTHWFDIQRGWAESVEDSRQMAIEWAERASGMDDADGQADTVLSHVHLMNGEFTKALDAGRRAITNRPGCANANGFFANVMHFCGEQEDAIRHIKLAMRFQPLYPPFFVNILASAYSASGAFQEAAVAAQQAIELAPSDILARLILARSYVNLGQNEMAKSTAHEILEIDPNFSISRFVQTQFYRDTGYLSQVSDDLLIAGLPN